MAGLAAALADQGADVVYVAEQTMSAMRAGQGWLVPDLGRARLELMPSSADVARLVNAAPSRSIHLCQGLRANGLVGEAQRALGTRGLRQWVVMETVDDAGWRGPFKRLAYRRLIRSRRSILQGVLATGHRTAGWLAARGMPAAKVYPFAYFLPVLTAPSHARIPWRERYRFLFVGQMIERKRLDVLIAALAELGRADIELTVIGSGPLERVLRNQGEQALRGRINWLGRIPMTEVPAQMASADCLVLPSRHDGWGAVVSEALMVGTPVICSDACGSAGVVQASGVGGAFPAADLKAFSGLLAAMVDRRPPTDDERSALADWAHCLGAEAGARYFLRILNHVDTGQARPEPPWLTLSSGRL
jgi:glycosyltransferase involved in cell wall biosynthesis